MAESTSALQIASFQTLGELLRFLRRRARISQRELSIATGYSESQISRLESNKRPPDLATLAALFAPALNIEDEPETLARLLELAALSRGEAVPERVMGAVTHTEPSPKAAPLPFAQARPDPPRRHNLPLQVTRFFGREQEVADLKQRLREQRLVTLSGSGGVGKTRLSLTAAEELLDEFPDGAWLVELAPLTDPALVPQQVAATLGVRDDRGRPVLETLTNYLRERQVLIVLDNCEHLLEACAKLADSLLRACPRLHLLASSREPLGVAGEAVFPVPSLPFPEPGQDLSLDALTEFASVQLYLDRARLLQPGYQPTAGDQAAVARIVQRLDGIPLAIEMAASRVNVLSAEQLASRLDDVFRVLTGGSRTAVPRQQTLRATIDWSYKLLSEAERLLLQRLAVFAGGCTLEAAESVCADPPGEGIKAEEVLDLLASLVAKSLVFADHKPDQSIRYHLLETVRQYAREKLQDAGEGDRLYSRHRDYFLLLAETANEKRLGGYWLLWFGRLNVERENFRQALEWSFGDTARHADLEAGPTLVSLLSNYLVLTNREMLAWEAQAVVYCQEHTEISRVFYARLLGLAAFRLFDSDVDLAMAGLKEAVELSRQLGPEGRPNLARNLIDLADRSASLTDYEPIWALLAEAETITEAAGHSGISAEEVLFLQGRITFSRARLANKQKRWAEAKKYAAQGVRFTEPYNRRWAQFNGGVETGDACLGLGELDQARENYLSALSVAMEVGIDLTGISYLNREIGNVELRLGNVDRAREYSRASLHYALADNDHNFTASGLALAASVWARQSARTRAAKLSGVAHALYASSGRPPWEDSSLDTIMPGWRDSAEAEAISAEFEAGLALNADQAMAYAKSVDVG